VKAGLLLLAAAILLGGLVGTLVVDDPGYVLVSYGDMALETSLWFALILLGAIYLLIRLIMFIFTRSLSGTGRVGRWLRQRKGRQAQQRTVQGLILMAEGQWADARKTLAASAREVDTPLINYLSAARAAHELGDTDGRDELLRLAHESTPGSRFAVGLTQAELQMSAGQWEQCLATLLQLKRAASGSRHTQVLAMLARVYRELGDWAALIELLPEMRKRKIMTEDELADTERTAWCRRFASGKEDPEIVWQTVPRELKRDTDLVFAYASALLSGGSDDEAESTVRNALQHRWSEALVDLYGRIAGSDPERQLVTAEAWLKERPNDPRLLLTLGRVCLMNQEWAKAREYLETSLRLQRSPEVYGELGRLCVALGDEERGTEYLSRATVELPSLPLPNGETVQGPDQANA
jgi:HemY protein